MSVPDAQVLWLAALLHGIGRLPQRFGGEAQTTPPRLNEAFLRLLRGYLGEELAARVAALVTRHADPSDRYGNMLHIADRLAGTEPL